MAGIIVLVVVLGFQVYVFLVLLHRIEIYKKILPSPDKLHITSLAEIENKDSILQECFTEKDPHTTDVRIIQAHDANRHFENILNNLNCYLIRNLHTSVEFWVIKDIIERPIIARQKAIYQLLPVPILLGLLGTFASIIIGLKELSGSEDPVKWDMSEFLGSISTAMIASFLGVLLTIAGSWMVRNVSEKAEMRKTALLGFIQIHLLPGIDTGLSYVIGQMHKNLQTFNQRFSVNIQKLDKAFAQNEKILDQANEILSESRLDQMAKLATETREIIKRSNNLAKNFENLDRFLPSLEKIAQSNEATTSALNESLQRIESIERIAQTLEMRLNESKRLLDFLHTHFSNMEGYKEAVENSHQQYAENVEHIFESYLDRQQQFLNSINDHHTQILDAISNSFINSQGHASALIERIVEHFNTLIQNINNSIINLDNLHDYLQQTAEETNQCFAQIASEFRYKLEEEKDNVERNLEQIMQLQNGLPQRILNIEQELQSLAKNINNIRQTIQNELSSIAKKLPPPKERKTSKLRKFLRRYISYPVISIIYSIKSWLKRRR